MDVKRENARRKVSVLMPFLDGMRTVLDFGCGDLQMAKELRACNKKLSITGVDVVDFGVRPKGIWFRQFDGKTLPYKDKTFDAAVAYHVFHHTNDPAAVFAEVSRVAKKRVLFVEPVARGWWDIPGMMVADWLFNVWKGERIPMAYKFYSRTWWERQVKMQGLTITTVTDVEVLPFFFLTGRSLFFVCDTVRTKI